MAAFLLRLASQSEPGFSAERASMPCYTLENCPVILPLLPHLRRERDEADILSKFIEIGISLE